MKAKTEKDKGVRAAIVTAVTSYMAEEEEARLMPAAKRVAFSTISAWRASGREEIMRMRALWQRRIT